MDDLLQVSAHTNLGELLSHPAAKHLRHVVTAL